MPEVGASGGRASMAEMISGDNPRCAAKESGVDALRS